MVESSVMEKYVQLPIEEPSQFISKGSDYFWSKSPSKNEKENGQYMLTRSGFLDAVWNRIEFVHFRKISYAGGLVYPLPNFTDKLGRTKVSLTIDSGERKTRQAKTLVHEIIHVDRHSWDRFEGFALSEEFDKFSRDEERIVRRATNRFYKNNRPLALLALNHVWLRRIQDEENP